MVGTPIAIKTKALTIGFQRESPVAVMAETNIKILNTRLKKKKPKNYFY